MLTEKEVLERAFRALDELAARPVNSQSEAKISESYTQARHTPETPRGHAEMQHKPELTEPTPKAPTSSLKGQAVELWRDGRRFFLVADDEDAQEAILRFGAHRGEVWTSGELELVASIPDQAVRDEVESLKRLWDGCLPPDAAGQGVPWAEYQAKRLNELFRAQGLLGESAKVTSKSIKHGEWKGK